MARAASADDRPQHPGEHLRLDVIPRLFPGDEIAARRLADALGVTINQLSGLIRGAANVTPIWALRLGRVVGPDAKYWMDLQRDYDLYRCEQAVGAAIAELEPVRAPKANARRVTRKV